MRPAHRLPRIMETTSTKMATTTEAAIGSPQFCVFPGSSKDSSERMRLSMTWIRPILVLMDCLASSLGICGLASQYVDDKSAIVCGVSPMFDLAKKKAASADRRTDRILQAPINIQSPKQLRITCRSRHYDFHEDEADLHNRGSALRKPVPHNGTSQRNPRDGRARALHCKDRDRPDRRVDAVAMRNLRHDTVGRRPDIIRCSDRSMTDTNTKPLVFRRRIASLDS